MGRLTGKPIFVVTNLFAIQAHGITPMPREIGVLEESLWQAIRGP